MPQQIDFKEKLQGKIDYLLLSVALLISVCGFSNLTIRVRLFKSVFFLSAFAIFVAAFLWNNSPRVKIHRFYWPLFVYFGVSLLSSFCSPLSRFAFIEMTHTLVFGTFFIILTQSRVSPVRLLRDLSFIQVVVVVSVFLEYLGYPLFNLPVAEGHGGRAAGFLINPNFLGDFMAVILPVFFVTGVVVDQSVVGGKRWRIWFNLVWILSFLALLLSRTRTGMLAVAGAALLTLGILFLSRMRGKIEGVDYKTPAKLFFVLILLAGGIFTFLDHLPPVARFLERFDPEKELRLDNTNIQQRISAWESAALISREYLWLGSGPGTFKWMYPAYKQPYMWKLNPGLFAEKAHQQYLEFVSERGVLGLLAAVLFFGMLLAEVLNGIMKNRKSAIWGIVAISGLIGAGISGLADSPGQIFPPRIMFSLVLALPFLDRGRYRPHPGGRPEKYPATGMAGTLCASLIILMVARVFLADIYGARANLDRLINRQKGENQLTIHYLETARELYPVKPNFINTMDEVLSYDGLTELKKKNFKVALSAFPTFPQYRLNLGNIYFQEGGRSEDVAEKYYLSALRGNLFYPTPYFMLGSVNLRKGNYDETLAYGKNYLMIGGDNTLVYRMILDALFRKEEYPKVVEWIHYTRSHQVFRPEMSRQLLFALQKMGVEYGLLKTAFLREAALFPENEFIRTNRHLFP